MESDQQLDGKENDKVQDKTCTRGKQFPSLIPSKTAETSLNIAEDINSPTFTIIHEYETGRLPLYHMDVYRLIQPEEMYDLGYEEYFYGEGVTVVEWAQMIESLLPEEYLGIEIVVLPEGRELRLVPYGARYEHLIEELTGCDYSKYR